MKKHSFIFNSAILLITVFITKGLGLFFKIPLTNLLGGNGMAYFSSAYSIFMPIYAISVTGLPTAICKLVSENLAFKKYNNIQQIFKVSLFVFSIIGIVSTLMLIIFAKPLSEHVFHSPGSLLSVLFISPCIYLGTIISVYRGYFEGLSNMIPTAISEILESITKVSCGLIFAYSSYNYLIDRFMVTGKVIGIICSDKNDALKVIFPIVSAAAIFGVTLSNFVCMIYMIIYYKTKKSEIINVASYDLVDTPRSILTKLSTMIFPIAIGSLVTNLTSLIDLASIIRCLGTVIENNKVYMVQKNIDVILNGISLNELPHFIYGSYNGLALTVFNIIPPFIAMLGKSVLPNISASWSLKNKSALESDIKSVLRFSLMIGTPAGLGILTLSKPILEFLFKSRSDEIFVSYQSLSILGLAVIFLSTSIPCFSIFQAIGRADIPLKILIPSVIIKLIGNMTLMRIDRFNILGAAISTTICYLYISICSLSELINISRIKLNILSLSIPILISSSGCVFTALLTYNLLTNNLPQRISLLLSIFFGVIFYILLMILLCVMTKYAKIRDFKKKIS